MEATMMIASKEICAVSDEMPNHLSAIISIPIISLKDWCLHLCCLRYGIFDSLDVTWNEHKGYIKIALHESYDISISRGTYRMGDDTIYIRITQEELDYWIGFFLRYQNNNTSYNPDIPNHIDVELKSGDTAERDMDLAITISK